MFNVSSLIGKILMVLVVVSAANVHGVAQDPAPSPTPTEEERRLEEENRILKLKKDNATLKNEIRQATLSPTATPLEGKTELSEVALEPQMMSYRAMNTTCNCIATKIRTNFPNAELFVIYDPTSVAELRNYRFTYPIFRAKLAGLNDRFRNNLPATAAPVGLLAALPIATDILKSFADVMAMFRIDTKIEGKAVTINQKALVAEMLNQLNQKYGRNIILYDPSTFSLDSSAGVDNNGQFRSAVLRDLGTAFEWRNRALSRIDGLSADIRAAKAKQAELEKTITETTSAIVELEASLKKAKTKSAKDKINPQLAEKKTALETAKGDLDAAKRAIQFSEEKRTTLGNLETEFEALITDLLSVDEKSGTSNLVSYMKSESLDMALKNDAATAYRSYYWLDISSVGAGGNNRTRKGLIHFFSGSKIDHSGGVILEWALVDPRWRFVDGGKEQVYDGYKTWKSIRASSRFDPADACSKAANDDDNLAGN